MAAKSTGKGLKGEQCMVLARREVSERIEVLNKKPMIRKNRFTGEMLAGFLNPVTGAFEVVMEINDEQDIDDFIDEYDLTVVMISKM